MPTSSLNDRGFALIRRWVDEGVLATLDLAAAIGDHKQAAILTCGDCHQAWLWLLWLKAELERVAPGFALHLHAYNGGGLACSRHPKLNGNNLHWYSFRDQMLGTAALKDIGLLFNLHHFTCGAASLAGVGACEQMMLGWESGLRIEEEIASSGIDLKLCNLVSVNYNGRYEERPMRTYFQPRGGTERWFSKYGVDLKSPRLPYGQAFESLIEIGASAV